MDCRLPLILSLLPLALSAAGNSVVVDDTPAEELKEGRIVFTLLPKSMQREPRLELNVITEMTPAGRKATAATPEKPVYYEVQPVGYLKLGRDAPAKEDPPALADLERVMKKALATNGYLPATPEHPATLLVFYYWGSHSHQTVDVQEASDEMEAAYADEPTTVMNPLDRSALEQMPQILADLGKRKELLERASLVGGTKFAVELAQAISDEVTFRSALAPKVADVTGTSSTISVSGDTDSLLTSYASPFYRFLNRDFKTTQLVEEAFSSFYFVVASAFDYKAIAKGKKLLLWRTKMSVNSLGVAMDETVPTLIVNAGRYFGRDMKDASILSKKVFRDGRVDIGTAVVVDYSDPTSGTKPLFDDMRPTKEE